MRVSFPSGTAPGGSRSAKVATGGERGMCGAGIWGCPPAADSSGASAEAFAPPSGARSCAFGAGAGLGGGSGASGNRNPTVFKVGQSGRQRSHTSSIGERGTGMVLNRGARCRALFIPEAKTSTVGCVIAALQS